MDRRFPGSARRAGVGYSRRYEIRIHCHLHRERRGGLARHTQHQIPGGSASAGPAIRGGGFPARHTRGPGGDRPAAAALREFYLAKQRTWAQGEGYEFDDAMLRTIENAMAYCPRGRFALSVVERDDMLIGAQLALRAGSTLSCWIIGYDAAWSRFGPGIAAVVEAFDSGARSGIMLADLGVGDETYKNDLHDGDSVVPLESVTWCRPRLARMLSPESPSAPGATSRADP